MLEPTITLCDGTPFAEKIEIGFDGILPDLPLSIQNQLEKEILLNGIQTILEVRLINGDPNQHILINGHIEYQMAIKHRLPITIRVREFNSDDDVLRYIITNALFRVNLTTFQKGELVLCNKNLLTGDGKWNMRLGGKGVKISEKVDVMAQLAAMIGKSHDTLRKIEYILNTLEATDERLDQLRSGDISINSVDVVLKLEKKISQKEPEIGFQEEAIEDFFSKFGESKDTVKAMIVPDGKNKFVARSKFHIDEANKYQVVYINPSWNDSDSKSSSDAYLGELCKMNIAEIAYSEFCTLFIETPSKYLMDTINVINCWGFSCVDSVCISNTSAISSKYSNQNHKVLLICELDGDKVPKTNIIKRFSNSIINSDDVMSTINEMFDSEISKACIFSGHQEGFDSYSFDNGSKSIIQSNMNAA